MRLSLFSTVAVVTLSCLLSSEGSHSLANAVQIKSTSKASTGQDDLLTTLTQTSTQTKLESMTEAEVEAQLTSMIQAYAETEVQAQVEFLQTIKNFFYKYVLPVIYVLIALVGLNALNPWVTSFIRDWHRTYPGACMYPNAYQRAPGAAAQIGSVDESKGTWLDAVRAQGIELS